MSSNAPFSGMRLLIVDDEQNIRMLARRLAESWGYEVDEAMDAPAALDYLARYRYNIILTDIRMPKMDGLEFAEKIRVRTPSVAVIIMTGYASPKTAKKSHDMGVVYYLKKPIRNNELAEILRIAALWNITVLMDKAAKRYLILRKGHEREQESRLALIKVEIKKILRRSGNAKSLRDLVYEKDATGNELFADLNKHFSTDSVKEF